MKSNNSKSVKYQTDMNRNKEKTAVSSNEKKVKLVLPQKQFVQRESLLTQLFEGQETVRSVYRCFISFFLIFMFTSTIKDVFYQQRFPKGLSLIYKLFGKLQWVCLIWIGNNLCTFLAYHCFLIWGKTRQKVTSKNNVDSLGILLLIGYYLLTFMAIPYIVFNLNLPFASASIVVFESLRFLMKTHAFVRENASKVLVLKSKEEKIDLPSFSKFLYFLYAPTLIYRDEYPRSTKIRPSYVYFHLLEIVAVIIFFANWFEHIAAPYFKDTCKTKLSIFDVGMIVVEFSLPAILTLWGIFFTVLHSTQNVFGEILRFGDRMFYKEWWTSPDVQTYYRRWNLIVGDWLYTYIYKDLHEIFFPKKKILCKFVTVLISAIVHEWFCTVITGYFFPIVSLPMLLSIVALLFEVNKNSSVNQLIFTICTILNISFMTTLYCLEYFTRINFPEKKSFQSVFWTDNCIEY